MKKLRRLTAADFVVVGLFHIGLLLACGIELVKELVTWTIAACSVPLALAALTLVPLTWLENLNVPFKWFWYLPSERKVLVAGTFVFLLVGLFPRYHRVTFLFADTSRGLTASVAQEKDLGYRGFLLDSPERSKRKLEHTLVIQTYQVDYPHLAVEWLLVVAATGVFFGLLRRRAGGASVSKS